MIAALVASAFALECTEVVHMEEAGVSVYDIVRELKASVTPVDDRFVDCLSGWGVDEAVLDTASQLRRRSRGLIHPLSYEQPVPDNSWIELDLMCGTVVVEGADVKTFHVEGMGEEGSRLVTVPSERGARIQLSGPGLLEAVEDGAALPRFDRGLPPKKRTDVRPCANLKLRVPRDTRVVLKSTRADVQIHHVDGPLELTTLFGDMELVGATGELVLKTTNGNIFADTAATHVDVESVSGRVEIGLGAGSRVAAETISGALWFWGGPVERLYASSVSGNIQVNVAIEDAGDVSLTTHNGGIEARVPPGEVAVSSREGWAWGLNRKIRPNSPSQRIPRQGPPPGRPEGFSRLKTLGAGSRGLWGEGQASRWWFRSGAVLSPTISMAGSGYTMKASSFSGNVRAWSAERFPGSTGPLIAVLDGVSGRFESCVQAQQRRHPGVDGHAVLSMIIDEKGKVVEVIAPAKSEQPEVISDGRFSKCVVDAVADLGFPEGPRTELRWPVSFRKPVEVVPVEPPRP